MNEFWRISDDHLTSFIGMWLKPLSTMNNKRMGIKNRRINAFQSDQVNGTFVPLASESPTKKHEAMSRLQNMSVQVPPVFLFLKCS